MPMAPSRPCSTPRCASLAVTRGKCAACSRQREAQRGTRQARGYDEQWLKLRAWFIRQPENVLCRMCTAQGRTTIAEEVDHIVPFEGRHDPKRLDPRNLQGLCIPCHRVKTAGRHD